MGKKRKASEAAPARLEAGRTAKLPSQLDHNPDLVSPPGGKRKKETKVPPPVELFPPPPEESDLNISGISGENKIKT